MRNLDFSSWHALLSTVFGLLLITLVMVGVRLLAMHTVQKRRERENRQINERLRTLIAAYKTLGGSFTGDLSVDPRHLRELRQQAASIAEEAGAEAGEAAWLKSDRARRMRDAVEAALSDIILLGTEEQVRLAARAATELAEGRPTHTADLVVSLRDFIRQVLDLEVVPRELAIPRQGPTRIAGTRGKGDNKGDAKGGGKGGGGGLGGGMGGGMGGHASLSDDHDGHH
jgi:hypothetical protein